MSLHDEARFAKTIGDFVDGCGFERPFHLVCIDAPGSTGVTRSGFKGIDQICSGPSKGNRLRMLAPLTVAVIGSDGSGTSARIEIIESARTTVQ